MKDKNIKPIYFLFPLVLILSVCFAYLAPSKYFFIKLIFFLFFLTLTIGIGAYSFEFKRLSIDQFFSVNRYPTLFVMIIVLIFLPTLTDSFYYYDDYWMFPGHNIDNMRTGIALGRIFQGLLGDLFSFVNPSNIYYIRWFTVFCSVLFGLVLYKWTLEKSKKPLLSFLITLIITGSSVMADCTSYASIVSYSFGLALAAFSVVLFEEALLSAQIKRGLSSFAFTSASGLLILATYHAYQLAIPVIFLMFAIQIFYSDDRSRTLRLFIGYLGLMFLVTILYYVSLSLLSIVAGIPLNNRSMTIKSVNDILNKAKWFIGSVLPGSIDRVIACFGGKLLFANKSYGYYVKYKVHLETLAWFLRSAVIFLMTLGISFDTLKRKKYMETLLLVAAIPASYFVYLLLSENGYLSYYAFPLISVLLFFMIEGINQLFSFIRLKQDKSNIFKYYILGALTICLLLQSNTYMRQYWVQENSMSFQYLKNTIMTSLSTSNNHKIHIYGVPNFGQANIYSVFATELALWDMGRNPNQYEITVSDNQYYLRIIEKQIFDDAKERLAEDERKRLDSYYQFEPIYSQYHLNQVSLNQEKLFDMKRLFEKSGMLPSNFDKVTTVNLTWVTEMW